MLGPTDPRDAAGFGVDIAADPFTWVGRGTAVRALDWSRFALNAVDQRERALDSIDLIKKTALDPYATFRSLFRQHRRSQIEAVRNDNRATILLYGSRNLLPLTVEPPRDTSMPDRRTVLTFATALLLTGGRGI